MRINELVEDRVDEFLPAVGAAVGGLARGAAAVGNAAVKGVQAAGQGIAKAGQAVGQAAKTPLGASVISIINLAKHRSIYNCTYTIFIDSTFTNTITLQYG